MSLHDREQNRLRQLAQVTTRAALASQQQKPSLTALARSKRRDASLRAPRSASSDEFSVAFAPECEKVLLAPYMHLETRKLYVLVQLYLQGLSVSCVARSLFAGV